MEVGLWGLCLVLDLSVSSFPSFSLCSCYEVSSFALSDPLTMIFLPYHDLTQQYQ